MANKYIRHGATYCGDGTTPDLAASDGAPGAWNNINVFEGTTPAYGMLAAGDVVYIRSKDESGAAITRTMTTTTALGSAVGTNTVSVFWVIDNGAIWPGIDGTITYQKASTATGTSIKTNNQIKARTAGALVIKTTGTTPTDATQLLTMEAGTYLENARLDTLSITSQSGRFSIVAFASGDETLVNPIIKVGTRTNGIDEFSTVFASRSTTGRRLIVNPDIELTVSQSNASGVFGVEYSAPRQLVVLGGSVYGVGAYAAGARLVVGASSEFWCMNLLLVGFQYPSTMTIDSLAAGTATRIEIIGCDGGVGGFLGEGWGIATSRSDNYPPVLSATLPNNAGTKWSWMVYPKSASHSCPMKMTATKLFTDTAGVRTIRQEVLVADNVGGFVTDKSNVWIDVSYIDSTTGVPKSINSRLFEGGALTSSTADWSATSWGAILFKKVKFELTTPTAIKQDTMITVAIFCTVPSVSANDVFFIDPDFAVVT